MGEVRQGDRASGARRLHAPRTNSAPRHRPGDGVGDAADPAPGNGMVIPVYGGIRMTEPRTLTGDCNRCGRCCSGRWGGRALVCEHLIITKPLGEPEATSCAVYGQRFDRMPIRWVDPLSRVPIALATCWKDSPDETAAIIASGLGHGCSLGLEP